jgi:pimeloyl-ACP methyl ester carboxylesterase
VNEARLATLLFDLLTKGEQLTDQTTGEFRFDILLLARRLADTVDSVTRQLETAGMNIGLFGASTGAAAALITAAERTNEVAAVISRGGRPRSCMGIITASEFRIPWRHLIARRISGAPFVRAMFWFFIPINLSRRASGGRGNSTLLPSGDR